MKIVIICPFKESGRRTKKFNIPTTHISYINLIFDNAHWSKSQVLNKNVLFTTGAQCA